MKAKKEFTQLELKVLAVNTLQLHAKRILDYEIEQLTKLVGIDCFKVDGSLKQKYMYPNLKRISEKFGKNWLTVDYWSDKTEYDYRIHVKICINGGSYDVSPSTAFCIYQDESYYPFDIKDGKLKAKTNDYSFLNEVFSVEKLEVLSDKVKEIATQYEKMRDKIDYRFHGVLNIERLTR